MIGMNGSPRAVFEAGLEVVLQKFGTQIMDPAAARTITKYLAMSTKFFMAFFASQET